MVAAVADVKLDTFKLGHARLSGLPFGLGQLQLRDQGVDVIGDGDELGELGLSGGQLGNLGQEVSPLGVPASPRASASFAMLARWASNDSALNVRRRAVMIASCASWYGTADLFWHQRPSRWSRQA